MNNVFSTFEHKLAAHLLVYLSSFLIDNTAAKCYMLFYKDKLI